MAKRKEKKIIAARPQLGDNVEILSAGEVLESPITDTLETNYMPYAMSVIVSRALPEIDGFKPAHRKLLYTMYGMGLLKGNRTKSANIVGSTMHLNPHGDAAIYDTMVRMGRSNESLLVPFVDSKGNFGKAYSRDMAYAAARYTEAKLEPVCDELFRDIDKDTVDFVPNYDGTTTEPPLLPVTFPAILANNTLGIAVGMASNICSFNLEELCNATIALMKDPQADLREIIPAPDFVGGGTILYDAAEMQNVLEKGRGSVRVRAQWSYDKENNCIDVTRIPPTTTVEAIMDKITELVKLGKIREISDMRDETDLNGLKLTIDLKRGQDPDKLMARLFKATPLEDSFACNFNVLIGGQPKVLGVRDILLEWIAFRAECVRRRTYYDLKGKEKRLHLLQGLKAILLDIDKAIEIVRNTAEESEVVPNLMIGFGIDEVQAEYVAEIKLRHLNREYILKRTEEIEELEDGYAFTDIYGDRRAVTIRQRREEHGVFGLVIDKTDAYNEIVRLRNISQHDQLTGLYNSSYLKKEGQKILDENANRVNALVFCDLDNLKYINDNFGHEMGDRYLKAMADLLTSMTQGEQCIAVRLSGDEFVLFFYGYDNRDVIEQKVRDGYAGRPSLRLPDGTDHRINASIGLAYAQRETESMDGLLNRADRAMYRVKHGEKNGIAIYDKSDEAGPA